MSKYLAKDFIETSQGLIFAVVAEGIESGRIRCFLRYVCEHGHWRKILTDEANRFLMHEYPEYLFYSEQLDAALHAVEQSAIIRHYSPRLVLQKLLQTTATDRVLEDLQKLCGYLQEQGIDLSAVGVTGSLLLGLQNPASDIDLVCYDRELFQRLRNCVQNLIAKNQCQALDGHDWLAAYQRRACELSLDEYIWHEQRKYNKAIIHQRKFDLSLVLPANAAPHQCYRKLGNILIQARVVDDSFGFDYPAEFAIDHDEIRTVVSFTATYTGQAKTGEQIQVAGQLECDEQGWKRIVVGSSREAVGEYIKVIH